MTKIDIISGFLGAGKTTLIKKLLKEAYVGQKVVLIENEFGEIGIDGGFMKEAGIEITEMNSGCICCSLVGDFAEALKKVLETYKPDRILIEPSGVGKLSDVVKAVSAVCSDDVVINCRTAVADATKCKIYTKNFGEFYNNQLESASTIILSRTSTITDEKLENAIKIIREHNKDAEIVTTPWEAVDGKKLLDAMEGGSRAIPAEWFEHDDDDDEEDEHCHCHCHDHDHDEDDDEHEHCHCHDHHDDDDDEHEHEHCHCHEHHDHDHDEDDDEHEHCHCHCHDHEGEEGEHEHHHHHHHHGHDADEVFTSWGSTTSKKFNKEDIESYLKELDTGKYGAVVRAKGIVAGADGQWIHFDYVPEEANVRFGTAEVTGKLCVIGAKLDEEGIEKLFGVEEYERV